MSDYGLRLNDYTHVKTETLDNGDVRVNAYTDIDRIAHDLARQIDDALTDRILEILENEYGYTKPERLSTLKSENEKLREMVRGVVRCRNCKFSINDGMQCKRHKDSGWNGNAYCEEYAYVNPDGYCAWGESKEATEL